MADHARTGVTALKWVIEWLWESDSSDVSLDEAQMMINQAIDGLDARFQLIDYRLDLLDDRMGSLDDRIDEILDRLPAPANDQ